MDSSGFKRAESSDEADIVIINTCGFIKSAKEESIDVILDELNGSGERHIVVTGCLTERYKDEITRDMPEIDMVYGVLDDHFLAELGKNLHIRINRTPEDVSRIPLFDSLPYAYIKISEGCSHNCNYCSIPLIRGRHNSYHPDLVLDDAKRAVAGGAIELIIIAQDITAYRWGDEGLPWLINRISEIDGVRWIRLLYCHPDHITDDIIDLVRNNRKIVRYLDIPFQHVSGRILQSMGRKGNFEVYHDLVKRIRGRIPEVRIRSTFMLGYPGETEEDFGMVLDFLQKAKLDRVGGFVYSREENTGAYALKGQVPEKIKKRRYREFMELQGRISTEKLVMMIGSEVDVIIEEKVDETTFLGRSEFDAPEVDGIFFLTSGRDIDKIIVRAKVTGAVDYDLMGELA